MSKICVYCSATLEDGAKFCNICGRSADTAIPEKHEEKVMPLKEAFEQQEAEKFPTESSDAATDVSEEENPSPAPPSLAEDGGETTVNPEENSENEGVTEVPLENASDSSSQPENPVHTEDEEPKAEKPGPKKKKTPRKLTAVGVISAIFLTILIILNVALIFGCSLGYGVANSDVYNYRFHLGDGYTFALSDIKNSDPSVAENTSEVVKGVFDVLEHFSFNAGEKVLAFDFSDDSRYLVETAMENSYQFEEVIKNAVEIMKTATEWFMIGLGGYIILVTVIFIIMSVVALAKKRSAIMVPGIVLMVTGIAGMIFVLISAFTQGIIGIAAISELFAIDSVVMSTLITTASSSIIGTILVAIGSTGKKN